MDKTAESAFPKYRRVGAAGPRGCAAGGVSARLYPAPESPYPYALAHIGELAGLGTARAHRGPTQPIASNHRAVSINPSAFVRLPLS
jgi:hypothetical protein